MAIETGNCQPTNYLIRYFLAYSKEKQEMDNGTVFLPNGLYPLEKETFLIYYTSALTDCYIIDSFGQMQLLSLSFNSDRSENE